MTPRAGGVAAGDRRGVGVEGVEMTKGAKACPKCRGMIIRLGAIGIFSSSYLYCGLCGYRGPIESSAESALVAWNDMIRSKPMRPER